MLSKSPNLITSSLYVPIVIEHFVPREPPSCILFRLCIPEFQLLHALAYVTFQMLLLELTNYGVVKMAASFYS